jgi:hypothetical protein
MKSPEVKAFASSVILVEETTSFLTYFEMTGFAREVLKWLQSMDLGVPIKHPRRDFANGYLIAVIFSRYYPGELRPWSLYTGNSESLKLNNWEVLVKCTLA